MIYRPGEQVERTDDALVRSAGDPKTLAPAVRTVIRAMDPHLPVLSLKTMREVVRRPWPNGGCR